MTNAEHRGDSPATLSCSKRARRRLSWADELCQLDSGASVNAIPLNSALPLVNLRASHGDLSAANDTSIRVEEVGDHNELFKNVHRADINKPLASAAELQRNGMGIYFPPDKLGCVVFDGRSRKIIARTDGNYEFPFGKLGTDGQGYVHVSSDGHYIFPSPYCRRDCGQRVHVDTFGNFDIKSVGGNDTVYIFRDAYAGYAYPVLAKGKSAATANLAVQEAKEQWRLHGHSFECLVADADSVFAAAEHQDYLRQEQIHSEIGPPGVHEHVGKVERHIQLLGQRVAAMFSSITGQFVPRRFWSYAIVHALMLLNITPSLARADGLTPLELFTGQKPDFASLYLLPFGSPVETKRYNTSWRFGERVVVYRHVLGD